MKKFIIILLCLGLVLATAACANDEDISEPSEDSSVTENTETTEVGESGVEESFIAETTEESEASLADSSEAESSAVQDSSEPVADSSVEEISIPSGGWVDSGVAEEDRFAFATLTIGVPEPQSSYTVNSVSEEDGLCFSFLDEGGSEEYKQIIQILSDFKYIKQENGIVYYENASHTIDINGVNITLKLK